MFDFAAPHLYLHHDESTVDGRAASRHLPPMIDSQISFAARVAQFRCYLIRRLSGPRRRFSRTIISSNAASAGAASPIQALVKSSPYVMAEFYRSDAAYHQSLTILRCA